MKIQKLKSSRLRRWIIPVILILALIAAGALAFRHQGSTSIYYLMSDINAIFRQKVSLLACSPDTLGELVPISESNTKANDILMLINDNHPLDDGYVPDICEYKQSGVIMNTEMAKAYEKLSERIYGLYELKLYVTSTFRTAEEQQTLYDEDSSNAAKPGASEHQTGLAADVYVTGFSGKGFINCTAGRYVSDNAYSFGFIIRYPRNKADVTGFGYEPWHIRYVGHPHSDIIYRNSLALEEYIDMLEPGKYYKAVIDNTVYLIARLSPDSIYIPSRLSKPTYSYDNTGYLIISGILPSE